MISLKKYWIEKSKIVSWDQYPIEAFKKKKFGWECYKDGKINIFKNCITNNLISGSKIALITINKEKIVKKYSYTDLNNQVNLFIYYLNKNFLLEKKEKRMMIHSSSTIEFSYFHASMCKIRNPFFSSF